jgi:hypothetical protein
VPPPTVFEPAVGLRRPEPPPITKVTG